MSYDELLFSAFYAVACPTYFINNGERRNVGKQGDEGSFEPEGKPFFFYLVNSIALPEFRKKLKLMMVVVKTKFSRYLCCYGWCQIRTS